MRLLVELRVERIEVLRVEIVGNDAQSFAEPLVMHDLARPQEADRVAHVRVVAAEAQDVVVG